MEKPITFTITAYPEKVADEIDGVVLSFDNENVFFRWVVQARSENIRMEYIMENMAMMETPADKDKKEYIQEYIDTYFNPDVVKLHWMDKEVW